MTEFDFLMRADMALEEIKSADYKIYADRYGGMVVKGCNSVNIYTNMNEYQGENEGEKIYNQVMAIKKELEL